MMIIIRITIKIIVIVIITNSLFQPGGFPLSPQLHIYPLEIELKKENISPSVASFLGSGNRNFKSPYDKRSSFPFFIVRMSQSAK